MAYAYPEVWLANAIQASTGVDAHPVMAPRRRRVSFRRLQTGCHRTPGINEPANGKHAYMHNGSNDLHPFLYAGKRPCRTASFLVV